MQDANQRQGERYAEAYAKSSELAELADINTQLAQLDLQTSLLRVRRRRIMSRIAKRKGQA